MARLYLIILLAACPFSILHAQVYSVNETDSVRGIKFHCVASIGVLYGTESAQFGKAKKEYLDGKDPFFRNYPALALSLKYRISPLFRISLNGDFTSTYYGESIEQKGSAGTIVRNLYEDINVSTFHIVPALEIIPYSTQFKSYFSIGAGLANSEVRWNETVYKTFGADRRNSGIVYNKSALYPAFRISTGLELGFDKNHSGKFLGGLVIEMRYNHIFRKDDYFGKIMTELEIPDQAQDKDISLLNSALSLNLGLSFNFYR